MKHFFCAILFLAFYSMVFASNLSGQLPEPLTFEESINQAVLNDPWLKGSIHEEKSLKSLSVAAGELSDPKIFLGLANLAADTFDFDQERMTQFKFGITQQFPRGKTRKIKKAKLEVQSNKQPLLRLDRMGQISIYAGSKWLDLFETQESIRIVKNSRHLFEKLVVIAQSSYSSAIAKTNQLDIVQAELELSMLDDRLEVLIKNHQMHLAQLSRWLNQSLDQNIILSSTLPNIMLIEKQNNKSIQFLQHPSILSLDKNIESGELEIKLAKQQYKPAWSLNLGYGYRENTPSGLDRSDLLSVGVNFDLPIFTAKRQDKKLEAAVQSQSALLTEKEDIIRKLMAMNTENSEAVLSLTKRVKLYEDELLPQITESIEIALRAYSSDEGSFDDVIRAQIAELDASLQLLKIKVEIQKRILKINYTRMNKENSIIHEGERS